MSYPNPRHRCLITGKLPCQDPHRQILITQQPRPVRHQVPKPARLPGRHRTRNPRQSCQQLSNLLPAVTRSVFPVNRNPGLFRCQPTFIPIQSNQHLVRDSAHTQPVQQSNKQLQRRLPTVQVAALPHLSGPDREPTQQNRLRHIQTTQVPAEFKAS